MRRRGSALARRYGHARLSPALLEGVRRTYRARRRSGAGSLTAMAEAMDWATASGAGGLAYEYARAAQKLEGG